MSLTYFPLLAASLIISFYFCYRRREGFSVDILLIKFVASLSFLLCGVMALILTGASIYGGLLIFGGILGLCGDVLLDMKGIYTESKTKYMFGGFITFLVGHIFYIGAMLLVNNLKTWQILICVVFSLLFAVGNVLGEKILKVEYGVFKKILAVYSSILIMTVSVSVMGLIVNGFSISRLVMMLGAIFFLISDLILSNTYFGKGFDGPVWYFSNHLTYYLAQNLIMTSIFFINQ